MPQSSKLLVLVVAFGGVLSNACGSDESGPHASGGALGASGSSGVSGGVHSGGAAPEGGTVGSGGMPSSGGATGGRASETGGREAGGAAAASSGGFDSGGAPAGAGGESSETGGRDTGGAPAGSGGSTSDGASAGMGGVASGGSSVGGAASGGAGTLGKFSFFMTSFEAMVRLAGSNDGFGGDLRFGEQNGLAGADKICTTIAEESMKGASAKGWRAFLSAVNITIVDGSVNAIDRVGEGPWYDRKGRLVAATKDDLIQNRPRGADPTIINDLPNEHGIPNHNPDGFGEVDNHDVMTGTDRDGKLISGAFQQPTMTCYDWTSSAKERLPSDAAAVRSGPWCGHSWGGSWIAYLTEGGCGAGVNLEQTGGPVPGALTVGTGGGYGAIYCLALKP